MNLFVKNAKIKRVDRITNVDRYGQPLSVAVPEASSLRVRFEKRTSSSIAPDGRQSRTDGVLMVSGVELKEQDVVTMSDDSVWTVFSTDDSLDVSGRVLFRTHKVVKKR